MIGPVSGTGRAMMASLQQAIQKGMPPDQAIQYVKSMATQGVAPLTDLYAMMNQFQRLKQQPVQAPQTPPTIRDQLNMAEQQQAQQQMAMQQGLGGLPAPAMEQAQFAGGGIVAFDEGGEVNPISYMQRLIREALARGDTETADEIRASLEDYTSLGRNIPRPDINLPTRSNLVDPREERFRQQQGMAPVAAAPSQTAPARPRLGREATGSAVMFPGDNTPQTNRPAPPAPPPASRTDTTSRGGIDSRVPAAPRVAAAPTAAAPAQLTREEMENQEYERIQAFRKREGLGSASEKLQQFLTDEGSKLDKQFGEDRMLAFAEAGFKMAAAASRPGATFLGAFSEGAISGTQALRGLQKEMNANRRSLKESMLKLEEAKELRKEGDFKTAMQQTQQARAEMFEIKKHADAMAMDERKLQAVIEGNRLQYAAATARGQPGALGADDVARNQLGVLNDRAAAARKIMSDYQMLMTPPTPEQKRAYAEAQREYADAERLRSQLTGLPYSGGPVAPAGGAGVIDFNTLK
jgi:hypothetical protein